MSTLRPQNESWEDCPPGELSRLAAHLDDQYRHQGSSHLLLPAVALIALAAVGAYYWTAGAAEENLVFGGIDCKTCKVHMVAYHEHLLGKKCQVDGRMLKGVKKHLKKCPLCGPRFKSRYPDTPVACPCPNPRLMARLTPAFVVAPRHFY